MVSPFTLRQSTFSSLQPYCPTDLPPEQRLDLQNNIPRYNSIVFARFKTQTIIIISFLFSDRTERLRNLGLDPSVWPRQKRLDLLRLELVQVLEGRQLDDPFALVEPPEDDPRDRLVSPAAQGCDASERVFAVHLHVASKLRIIPSEDHGVPCSQTPICSGGIQAGAQLSWTLFTAKVAPFGITIRNHLKCLPGSQSVLP